jgi:hypothetical protein
MMNQTKSQTQGSPTRKPSLGNNTTHVLGSRPARSESYMSSLRRLADEVGRQIAVCGNNEPASPDSPVILVEQMGPEYRSDLAELADNLESMPSRHPATWTDYGHETNSVEYCFSSATHTAFPLPNPSLLWQIPTFCEPHFYVDGKRSRLRCAASYDPLNFIGDFWDSEELFEWASAVESSVLLVQGDYQTVEAVEQIALDLVQYLEDHSHPAVWILNDPASSESLAFDKKDALLKQLAVQILQLNLRLHSTRYLPRVVELFQMAASKDTDWFDVMHFLLRGMPNLCMVIDLDILGIEYETTTSWMKHFSGLFERLRLEGGSILKIVFLNCWPIPKSDVSSESSLTIDIHARTALPCMQRAYGGLETSGFRSLPFPVRSLDHEIEDPQSTQGASPQ